MTVSRKRPQHLTLREYQTQVELTDERKRAFVSLLGLVSEIGDLQSIVKKALIKNRNPLFRKEISEELGDILWYVSSIASRYQLSLDEIAAANLVKAQQLFDVGKNNKFDDDYPEDERFPRSFAVVFAEKVVGGAVQVKAKINDVFIGDALDDNSHENDGYRYHDVFHFAYATVLGWSPVVRALLRRKRKSNPQVDRIEDGARAIFLEEAIAVFVFNQAQELDEYKEESSITMGLLKTIKKLSGKLEVNKCTAKQWQSAIYQGYKMFHLLQQHKGGTVHCDLDTNTLTFTPPRTRARRKTDAQRPRKELPRGLENGRGIIIAA